MKAGASIRRIVLAILAVIVLFAAGLAIWNSRGKSAWEKTRRALEARGECLDWREFVPPPVPDDQNFAMTPLLVPLFDSVNDGEGHLRPRDTNAMARVEHLFDGVGYLRGVWWRGRFADFNAWQKLLRGSTNETGVTDEDAGTNVSSDVAWVVVDQSSRRVDSPVQLEPTTDLHWSGRDVSPQAALRANAVFAAWFDSPPATSLAEDMLSLLRRNSAELDELRAALKRPYARFDIRYELGREHLRLWHLGVLKKFAFVFSEKALAELRSGKTEDALDDITSGLALADAIKEEPMLASSEVRGVMLSIMIQPVWEGLARKQWNAAQLAVLQARFERINRVADISRALRGERAMTLQMTDTIILRALRESNLPGALSVCFNGWIQRRKAVYVEAFQNYVLPPFDPTNRVVATELSERLEREVEEKFPETEPWYSTSTFARWVKSDASLGMKVARSQAVIDQAAIACALERFRLATGAYPERLDQLSPDFMEHVPCDPVNAQPLKYHRTDDGQFVLYSVGWNRADDGGQYVLDRSGHVIKDKSDWVWRYPAKQHAVTVEH